MYRVTIGNRKLGSICSVNLPAIVTCREDAPCKKNCYACKGHFLYPAVKSLYAENLRAFLEDKEQAEKDMISQLPKEGFCRIHASGDIPNKDYFQMLMNVANKCKKVKFMCFTKQYEIINEYLDNGGVIPKNFKMVFSGWLGLEMQNPHNLPTAYVALKVGHDDRIKKSALVCSGKCYECFACWNIKKNQQVLFKQH